MPRNWVAFAPSGLPVIMARLGNHRFPVLVDTGAARSLIAPATLNDCLLAADSPGVRR